MRQKVEGREKRRAEMLKSDSKTGSPKTSLESKSLRERERERERERDRERVRDRQTERERERE